MSTLPQFATVDPFNGMNAARPGVVQNLCGGQWTNAPEVRSDIVDPMNGKPIPERPGYARPCAIYRRSQIVPEIRHA